MEGACGMADPYAGEAQDGGKLPKREFAVERHRPVTNLLNDGSNELSFRGGSGHDDRDSFATPQPGPKIPKITNVPLPCRSARPGMDDSKRTIGIDPMRGQYIPCSCILFRRNSNAEAGRSTGCFRRDPEWCEEVEIVLQFVPPGILPVFKDTSVEE